MKYTHALLALNSLILVGLQPQIATATTLYTGEGLPENEGWLVPGAIQSNGFPTSLSETAISGGVEVDSDANGAEYAGYSNYNPLTNTFVNPNFPTLDSSSGYDIFFNATLDNDPTTFSDTDDNSRAAFSIIAIGTDNRGIEIGFDSNQIFAQSPDFMQVAAETQSFDTSSSTDYQLTVLGNTYQLLANTGSVSPVINGSLREYNFNPATSQPPLGTFNPYQIPNFLFFGDNTGQAYGTFTLGEVRVETATATASTPEANFTVALALMGIGLTTKISARKKV